MPSLLFEDEDINRAPETNYLPRYGDIPTRAPENTYTGAIPTPPSDTGSTTLAYPHDYYTARSLLKKSDPEGLRLLLELMYRDRDRRRT